MKRNPEQPEGGPVPVEREREIRMLLGSAARSRVHLGPAERIRDLLDAARDLRDQLDWEREQSRGSD